MSVSVPKITSANIAEMIVKYTDLEDQLNKIKQDRKTIALTHKKIGAALMQYCEETSTHVLQCRNCTIEFNVTKRAKPTSVESVITLVEERLKDLDGIDDISERFVDDLVTTIESEREYNDTKRLKIKRS